MKKFLYFILAAMLVITACKKDKNETDYNTLRFTSGGNEGLTHAFSPNRGVWADVDATTKSYGLVFGSTVDPPALALNTMDVFFYYHGNNTISFPSNDGQMALFSLSIDGKNCQFAAKNARLVISELSDTHMKGTISGDFTDYCLNEVAAIEFPFNIDIEPFND